MNKPMLMAMLGMVFLSACTLEIHPLTSAPPTRTAEIDAANDRIKISEGVALAVGCTDNCEGTCRKPIFKIDDPEMLSVRPAYQGSRGDTAVLNDESSVFVLIGEQPGTTRLQVRTSCTSTTYKVTVLGD